MTARGREAEYDAAAVRRRGQVVELAGAAGPKESEAAERHAERRAFIVERGGGWILCMGPEAHASEVRLVSHS